MKQRAAFVANSSSSSFLIIGNLKNVFDEEKYSYDDEPYEIVEKFRKESGLDAIQQCEDTCDCYVGKIVFQTSGSSMSVESLKEKITKAESFLNERGVTGYKAYFGESHCG